VADLGADLRAERGQILLIAAFAMAVTFVSLALVVNSAIFTENLASRGETSGSDDALVVRHEVQQSVGESIEYANTYNASSDATLTANVTDSVATIRNSVANQQASTGKIVAIEGPAGFNHGTRIRDNASAGGSNFTNASTGGTPREDWTVVSDVDRTRAFTMNLTDAPASDGFVVNLTADGSPSTWRMVVTRDTSPTEYTVTVHRQGTTVGSCTVGDSPEYVRIDLTRGLVGGQPCPHLRYGAGIDDEYDLHFNNSDAVTGNYSMIVDRDLSPTTPPVNLSGSRADDDPYVTHAIYAADVIYRYDGPDITYNTTVRVAPGEPR